MIYAYDDADYDAMLDDLDDRHRRHCEWYDEEGEEALTPEQRNPNL
jgi:hypothetical protein